MSVSIRNDAVLRRAVEQRNTEIENLLKAFANATGIAAGNAAASAVARMFSGRR